MKAEVGFAYDDAGSTVTERMQLRVEPDSPSESTLLAVLAKRLGIKPGIYGEIYFTEAPKP